MAPAGRALAFATAIAVAGGGPVFEPARAQEQATRGVPLIRDTEIENLMRDYATPILKTAGLAQQNVRVVILNDPTFNAFVMDGRHIFIDSGALFEAKTPNEVIGMFAHETGHLAGGHLMKLREELARAQTASIVALLAGVGAAVAGARRRVRPVRRPGGDREPSRLTRRPQRHPVLTPHRPRSLGPRPARCALGGVHRVLMGARSSHDRRSASMTG